MDLGERAAIRELQDLAKDRIIVIQPTDKTGGVAIMPFEAYDKSIKNRLNETYEDRGWVLKKYPVAKKGQLEKVFNEIVRILGEGHTKGYIGKEDLAAAIPDEPKAARLYGMCKDHKEIILELGIPPFDQLYHALVQFWKDRGSLWTTY